MTNAWHKLGTAYTIGKWTVQQDSPRATVSSETRVQGSEDVFLVEGRPTRENGQVGIAVTIAPAAVSKKLAIRKLNREVEGWTVQSDTFLSKPSK